MRKKSSKRLTVAGVVALVVVGSGWYCWHKDIQFKVIPREFAAVEKGQVYRSGLIHPKIMRKILAENDIQVIVSLSGRYRFEEAIAGELGIELIQYKLEGDGSGDINCYAETIEHIVKAKKARKPILVHCAAGTMRTGAAVAFYRLLVLEERDNKRIVCELRKHGWRTKKVWLPDYVNRNMYGLALILIDRGIIDEVPNPIPQIQSRNATTFSLEELKAMRAATTSIEIDTKADEVLSKIN